jgi:hypothetical protein
MPAEVLEYFSQEGGQHLLYELRFLPVNKRAAPAIYMAENGSDQRVRRPPGTACKRPAQWQRCPSIWSTLSHCSSKRIAWKGLRNIAECRCVGGDAQESVAGVLVKQHA